MDPYTLIQQSVAQNNAWSAQQAQEQMNFQREMSNTAFQRQVADMKAAGINPVLSARLGGASTPSGAMGGTDTSGTSALIELLQMSMETANAAAGAARAAAGSAKTAIQDNSAKNIEIPEDVNNKLPDFSKVIGPKGSRADMIKDMDKNLKDMQKQSWIKDIPVLGKALSGAISKARTYMPYIMKWFPIYEASKAMNMNAKSASGH